MNSPGPNAFCIPCTVRDTADKGRGVFADSAIKKGMTVWRYIPDQFVVYDEQSLKDYLSGMSQSEAAYVLEHIHCMAEFPQFMVSVLDDGALINHSEQPTLRINTSTDFRQASPATSVQEVTAALLEDHFSLIAARDIAAGEELTIDYDADPDDPIYYNELCEKYAVSWEWV